MALSFLDDIIGILVASESKSDPGKHITDLDTLMTRNKIRARIT